VPFRSLAKRYSVRPWPSTRIRPSFELATATFVPAAVELGDAEATPSPNISDSAAATAPIVRTKPFISCSFRDVFAIASR
jgi:hypothetical protein